MEARISDVRMGSCDTEAVLSIRRHDISLAKRHSRRHVNIRKTEQKTHKKEIN